MKVLIFSCSFFISFRLMDYPVWKPYKDQCSLYDVSSNIHIMFIGQDFRSSEKKLPFTSILIFPRQQHVKSIEENLLGVKNKIFTDVQVCFSLLFC